MYSGPISGAEDNYPALDGWEPFTEPSRGFDPRANLNLVPDAEFVVGQDEYGPIVRVNLLKIQNWTAVPGIKKIWKARYEKPDLEDTLSNLILSEVVRTDSRWLWRSRTAVHRRCANR